VSASETRTAAAGDEPVYRALLGALLLRQSGHEDALKHYLVALRSDPANPEWLIGAGMALEATGRKRDAMEAYQRASIANNLSPKTSNLLSDRLAQLKR
jgi:MSHA biogenesis protein MshN